MRKFKVKVNGKEYEVEVEEIIADKPEDKREEVKKDEGEKTNA